MKKVLTQLRFKFAMNPIDRVTSLGYIGGQEEELGGYCEPLVIQYKDGLEQFVLHSMAQSMGGEFKHQSEYHGGYDWVSNGVITDNYKKVIFKTREELLEAWNWVQTHLTSGNKNWKWQETDSVCGCDATSREFYRTKRVSMEIAA